jgi:hypothetical protein
MRLDSQRCCKRDHCSVVGAKFEGRIGHFDPLVCCAPVQYFTQALIRPDATGNDQLVRLTTAHRRKGFRNQHLGDGLLEIRCEIGLVRR